MLLFRVHCHGGVGSKVGDRRINNNFTGIGDKRGKKTTVKTENPTENAAVCIFAKQRLNIEYQPLARFLWSYRIYNYN